MKKTTIFTMYLLAAGSFAAFAQEEKPVYNETSGKGYDTFKEAFTDLSNLSESEYTWIITGTVEVDDRMMLENKTGYHVTVNVKGKDSSAKLVNKTTNSNHQMFVMKGGGIWTFEGITIDGGGIKRAKPLFEVDTRALVMKDVEITNYDSTIDTGVIEGKTNGTVEFENVKITEMAGNDFITLSHSNSTFKGVNSLNLHLAAGVTITDNGAEAGNNVVITFAELPEDDNELLAVLECTDASLYSTANEGYKLTAGTGDNSGSLVVIDDPAVAIPTAVTIEGKAGGYNTIDEALEGASDGDVILVNEDMHHNARHSLSKSVTIKGSTSDITLYNDYNNQAYLITANVTLENLILDGGNKNADKNYISVEANGHLTMINVTLKNYNSSSANKFLHVKDKNNVHLKGVKVENVSVNDNCGMVNINCVGSTISGDNNISLHLNSGMSVAVADGEEMTNVEPVELYMDSPTLGSTVVANCTTPEKFALKGENTNGMALMAKDGNLVLATDTEAGVEDVAVSESGEVEYFTLQGVKVSADMLAPGVYVKRQDGKASKVVVK